LQQLESLVAEENINKLLTGFDQPSKDQTKKYIQHNKILKDKLKIEFE